MKEIIAAAAAALTLTGITAAPALASSARPASVCQPDGTGCTKAGTYNGPDAVINSDFFGVKVVWTESAVQPYSSGVPLYWTAYMTYTNVTSGSLTIGCPGSWPNPGYVAEIMSGGSGNDGEVPADSTSCSDNPAMGAPLAPGASLILQATFHNVPWPGSSVAIQWGNAGTSSNVYPFNSTTTSSSASPDNNGNWAGYLAQTGNVATQVNGEFVQPKITCSKGESSSAGFWVGVSDSTGGGTIAQDGTSAFCYDGHPGYYLWWEAVGRSAAQGGGEPVPVLNTNGQGVNIAPAACKRSPKFTGTAVPSLKQLAFLVDNQCVTPIKPGYTIDLNVDVAPHSYVAFFASVKQTQFELNTSQTFSNVVAGGSEWVAETQHLGSGLSDFGKVTFTDCYVYTGTANTPGEPISNFNDLKLNLIYDLAKVFGVVVSWKTAASPGALTSAASFNNGTQDGFTVNWHNRGLPVIA
jgi:hypothetical protein